MTDKIETAVADRRNFLKLAGASAVTGGAAIATLPAKAAAERDAKAEDSRYRETAHVRRYYELAR